jgi:Fe-Mn family superoxide dismutase
MMAYEAKDFSGLLGTDGFSDALLNNHFKLYSGYVANTNKVAELLTTLEPGTPQYAELKRRFGWEFNGMRLHELYFHNISKEKKVLSEDSPLRKKIAEQFGGFQQWENDFKSLSGGQPLLVMDVFEHAFITDYGLNRASYLNAFMNAVDWEAVEKRVI